MRLSHGEIAAALKDCVPCKISSGLQFRIIKVLLVMVMSPNSTTIGTDDLCETSVPRAVSVISGKECKSEVMEHDSGIFCDSEWSCSRQSLAWNLILSHLA